MSEQVPASPGADGSTPVPRDPPDQQADAGQDPWDLEDNKDKDKDQSKDQAQDQDQGQDRGGDGPNEDVPDTDEAGTGRRGNAADQAAPSGQPVPDEPSG
ncbi:hypothetical protein AB0N81_12485 [Streptomyces sp. NPDC093510]|uniref:hypothetical protein n=1 Tax=Streptomyces sp. NPDC093510 TaxID=3155199 RepID=UPI003414DA62